MAEPRPRSKPRTETQYAIVTIYDDEGWGINQEFIGPFDSIERARFYIDRHLLTTSVNKVIAMNRFVMEDEKPEPPTEDPWI